MTFHFFIRPMKYTGLAYLNTFHLKFESSKVKAKAPKLK